MQFHLVYQSNKNNVFYQDLSVAAPIFCLCVSVCVTGAARQELNELKIAVLLLVLRIPARLADEYVCVSVHVGEVKQN